GFRALADEWDETGEIAKRTVKQAELMEITVTSIPAYPDSSLAIAKRSMKKGSNSRQKMQMWCDVLGA
ncbi:HK97 family phage prohead protease, partial [Haemophilus paracuniculus]|uniref:HK97 family phage prohead protease n=1 Tax=Haemophilus paracuniculus TaxID=734 RepID=UPI001B80B880